MSTKIILRCVTQDRSGHKLMDMNMYVSDHLRGIYDLLANGINQKVVLVKDDGKRFTYTLVRP